MLYLEDRDDDVHGDMIPGAELDEKVQRRRADHDHQLVRVSRRRWRSVYVQVKEDLADHILEDLQANRRCNVSKPEESKDTPWISRL
jgi:hypothetical protein